MKKLITILMVIVLLVAMTIVANADFTEEQKNNFTEEQKNEFLQVYEEYKAAKEAGDIERAEKLMGDWLDRNTEGKLEDFLTPCPVGVYKYLFWGELMEGIYTNLHCIRWRS